MAGQTFLDKVQIATLKDKGYTVKSNGFRITLYSNEFKPKEWKEICDIAGADISSESVTILSFAFIQK